jgi:mono/diheme cytochrome c family protein
MMARFSPFVRALVVLAGAGLLVAVAVFVYFLNAGLNARGEPGRLETFVALRLRNAIIGWHARNLANPVERSPDVIAAGRAHFADHCATCHANDGSGNTDYGRGMYPKPPDLRLQRTQDLTDGELFYIIENGVPLTGMPAFGTSEPSPDSATWHLVHFIRHLPDLSEPELTEMELLNPVPPSEWAAREEERRFLAGDSDAPAPPTNPPHKH